MSNLIKLKRGSGSDPQASDLVVGEVALRTDSGQLFTKKDSGDIQEIGAASGVSVGDKGDIVVSNGGETFTIDSGVVNNAKVASNAAIAGTKISPDFGSQDISARNLTLTDNNPTITWTDTDNNPDFRIEVNGGNFTLHDITNGVNKFEITPTGNIEFVGNVDFLSGGIDVTGNITGTGNLTGVKSIQTTGHDAITGTPHTYKYGRGSQAGGLSVYANESAIEVVGTDGSNHAASFLLRTTVDGAGFIYNPTDNALELKLFTTSANDFTLHSSGANVSDIDTQIRVVKNSKVELAHSGTVKFQTTSLGARIDTILTLYGAAGNPGRLRLQEGGALSEIRGVRNSDNNSLLYFDTEIAGSTATRLIIDENGHLKPSADSTYNLGTSGNRWANVFADALNIAGAITSTGNVTTNGDLTIQNANPILYFNDTGANPDYHIKNNNGYFDIVDGTATATRLSISNTGELTVAGNANFGNGVDVTGDITSTGDLTISSILPKITLNDTNNESDFEIKNENGSFRIRDIDNPTDRFRINSSGTIHEFFGAASFSSNIAVGGTVDGVDIAARNTLFGGLTSSSGVLTNGVTATTQAQSDNSNKVSTTAYVRAAVANLVNNAPSTLDTLNELSSALGADANFATTVTNSIATKLPLAGGTLTGNLTISTTVPTITFTDTDNNPDFTIKNDNGNLRFRDETNSSTRLKINSDGHVDIPGNLDVDSGIDVTGNITVSGTVDGRDLATDGTKLDGIEASATADQTASEILTLIKTVDGTGSGLDADTLDGISSASFVRSDAADTCSGKITFSDGIVLPTTGDGIKFGAGDAINDDAHIEWLGGSNAGYLRISTSDDSDDSSSSEYIEFGDYAVQNKVGAFTQHVKISRENFLVRTGSHTITQADRLNIASDGTVDIYGNLDVGAGLDVTGNITVSGTVDGRDVATDGSKLDGIESGATADQTASEILTLIKTVDGGGSGLDADTLDGVQGSNFLRSNTSDTMTGDLTLQGFSPDLNFVSTTNNPDWKVTNFQGSLILYDITNSANKFLFRTDEFLSLEVIDARAGVEVTGNITVSGTVDGRDVATDGTKLDGIESGATADQTITEIKSLIAGSPLGATHIATDAIGSAELAANAVTSAHIADGTITAADIATDAVGSAELAANAVSSAHIADGAIVNADINASAAIAGTKISPDFGSQNITTAGTITISNAAPNLLFTESDANPDFGILLSAGQLKFQDVTNTANILTLDSNKIQAVKNLDALAGIDVTGNITATGDLQVDGGDITIVGATPRLHLTDSGDNPDYEITNTNGSLNFKDTTNDATRISIQSSATTIANNLDCGAGIDVTGNITATGEATISGQQLTVQGTSPRIRLIDTDQDSDFQFSVDAGSFKIEDITNSADRFVIDSTGNTALGDTSSTPIGTAATLRVANSGSSAGYSVFEAASSVGSIRLANDGAFNVTGAATFSSGISTSAKDVHTGGGAIINGDSDGAFSDRSGSNIDHIWYQEDNSQANRGWNFCEDTTYKAVGQGQINVGRIRANNQPAVLVTNVTNETYTDSDNDDPIRFATTDTNNGGCTINSSRSRITVPIAGVYLLLGCISGTAKSPVNAGDGINLVFRKNGSSAHPRTDALPFQSFGDSNGEEWSFTANIVTNLAAGDYIEIALRNIGQSVEASIERGYLGVVMLH